MDTTQVAASFVKRLPPPLLVEGDVLIIADAHAPFHDGSWMNRVIRLAVALGVKYVVIAGDLVDLAAFSKYGRKLKVEALDEIESAEQIIDTLSAKFVKVFYIPGNHENRIKKALGHLLPVEKLMELWIRKDNVVTSQRRWCEVVSGGRKWRIIHPKNYNRNAAVNAKRIAAKRQCHVILAHSHTWGISRDDGDRYWVLDCGCCADIELLDYVQEEESTSPEMLQGACIVYEGEPILLSPHNIDFYEALLLPHSS